MRRSIQDFSCLQYAGKKLILVSQVFFDGARSIFLKAVRSDKLKLYPVLAHARDGILRYALRHQNNVENR